ncbi:MAG: YceI family protein [Pseudomonadota bacterium]
MATHVETSPTRPDRYSTFAVALHWTMALSFLLMLASGYLMVNYKGLGDSLTFNMFQWHKAGGVLLLLAAAARLTIKLVRPQPGLPDSMVGFERKAAKLGHWGFYGFMLGMPFTGWVMVSASVYGLPTIVYGWFEWPHIPGLTGNKMVQDLARNVHFYLSLAFALTIAGHTAAVFKHRIAEGINLLPRMWFRTVWQPVMVMLGLASGVVMLNMFSVSPAVPNASEAREPVASSGYGVDYGRSSVQFSGIHAGNEFSGTFALWNADIAFEDTNLDATEISVTFDLASASTGNSLYDGTLPKADWFNVDATPTGLFTSTMISRTDEGSYHMLGLLTLRGKALPVEFDFTLNDADGFTHVVAELPIDRLAYGIGADSDPDASWVGQEITIRLDIYARPGGLDRQS